MQVAKGKLFIVEDDPASRKALAALAASMKIKFETFASAEEFLKRYEPSLVGCALLDYRLGGMDGLQLQLKLQAAKSMLSVILISAYADVPMAVQAMSNGAATVIEKPYERDSLADAIRKAMQRSEEVSRLCEQSTVAQKRQVRQKFLT